MFLKYYILSIILLFTVIVAKAQKKTVIVFKRAMVIDKDDKIGSVTRIESTPAIDSAMNAKRIVYEKDLAKGLYTPINNNPDYTEAFSLTREGDEIIMHELSVPVKGKKLWRLNLKELSLVTIDSFTCRYNNDSVIVTKQKLGKGNALLDSIIITYQFTRERKIIKGYKCRKIIATSISKSSEYLHSIIPSYEIWATTKIRPAIPWFDLPSLCKPLFRKYTPLELKIPYPGTKNSYTMFTVIDLFVK